MAAIRIQSQFGQCLGRQTVAGQTLLHIAHGANQHLPRHEHALPHLIFVVAGGYGEASRAGESWLPSGSVQFHPAGSVHANTVGKRGGQSLAVELSSTLLSLAEQEEWRLPQRSLSSHEPLLCQRLLRELRQPDAATALAVSSLLLESLARLLRTSESRTAAPPASLRRVDEALRALPAGAADLDQLAALAACSRSHLVRLCRKHWGASPGERLRQLRLERALHLIATSTLSLAEIAEHCGFADQSHLTRAVRQATGHTPAALARHRPNREPSPTPAAG